MQQHDHDTVATASPDKKHGAKQMSFSDHTKHDRFADSANKSLEAADVCDKRRSDDDRASLIPDYKTP